MPPVRTQDKSTRPRQDPVSCRLCRVKKLKCDRQMPCSNCQSRQMACEYKGETPRSCASNDIPDERYTDETHAIKARLLRLERSVFGDHVATVPMKQPQLPPTTNAFASPNKRAQNEGADEDSTWLEAVGSKAEAVQPQFTRQFSINLQTIEETLSANEQCPSTQVFNLPTHDIAVRALDAYAEHLDAVQHIMHVETTRRTIDSVYSRIHSRQNVDPGALAFILALCANVGFYKTVGFHQNTALFEDQQSEITVATEWTRQALLALQQAHMGTSTPSLESIQGSIMVMFLIYHQEGFTCRVRCIVATTIAMAKDMGLHKTDQPGSRASDYTQAGIIETEVRRKVWWHLTCTDWFSSFITGPQEGMYNINPRHMHVNVPRNLTREDLDTEGPDFTRSLSEPTLMSYYLQRVKLGHSCREVADALWDFSDPQQVDSDIIKTLDAKFDIQIQELPRFLRFDIPNKQLRTEYGEAYDHQVEAQAMMVNLMINTRRCKLHLPYLVRAKTNPRFAFSRRMGLQAARAVHNVRRRVMEDENSSCAAHLKTGGIYQQIFYATVVLVMDLCVNRTADDKGQIAEVREALKVMEEYKQATHMGAKFYDSLMAVLRKHQVKLPNPAERARGERSRAPRLGEQTTTWPHMSKSLESTGQAHLTPSQMNPAAPNHAAATELFAGPSTLVTPSQYDDSLSGTGNGEIFFDDAMWQGLLDQGQMIEPQDWDALLMDIDSRLM